MLLSESRDRVPATQAKDYEQLSDTVSQSYHMQQYLIRKLEQVCQEQSLKNHKNRQHLQSITAQVSGFKQQLGTFRECSNEWLGIYRDLLYIINQIVTVYQIKIDKLEQGLSEAENTKKSVEEENAALKEMLEIKLRNNQSCSSNSNIISNSAIRRIKISDVIAEYQTNNSTDNVPMKPYDSKFISIMDMSHDEVPACGLSPSKISQISRIDPQASYQDFKSDSLENTIKSKLIDFPATQRETCTKVEPLTNNNAPNNYKRDSGSSVGRKRSKEGTEPARSASKLDQLRRNFLNRKKSQKLI